jgi:hypothetical protein
MFIAAVAVCNGPQKDGVPVVLNHGQEGEQWTSWRTVFVRLDRARGWITSTLDKWVKETKAAKKKV